MPTVGKSSAPPPRLTPPPRRHTARPHPHAPRLDREGQAGQGPGAQQACPAPPHGATHRKSAARAHARLRSTWRRLPASGSASPSSSAAAPTPSSTRWRRWRRAAPPGGRATSPRWRRRRSRSCPPSTRPGRACATGSPRGITSEAGERRGTGGRPGRTKTKSGSARSGRVRGHASAVENASVSRRFFSI